MVGKWWTNMTRKNLLHTLTLPALLASQTIPAMSNHHWFAGGLSGAWKVTSIAGVTGAGLAAVERVAVVNSDTRPAATDSKWILQGFTSNVRYATKDEVATGRSKKAWAARRRHSRR